jgi:hypothetical protein
LFDEPKFCVGLLVLCGVRLGLFEWFQDKLN